MDYTIYTEKLLVNDEWQNNIVVHVSNGKIVGMCAGEDKGADYHFAYLTPGTIDNHIHGGNLFHIHDAEVETMEKWLVDLAEAGVCGVMVTPYGSMETIHNGLKITKRVMERQKEGKCGGARIMGVHLEGPFISLKRPGAFVEETILEPSVETYKQVVEGYEDIIKEMTLAPEGEGAKELIEYLAEHGVKVLAGHTDCDFDTALQAFGWGVGAMCHTFNAARPIHHREPGIVAAALTAPEIYCEMIGDLEHLHPGTIRLLLHCKGSKRAMIVSDSIRTTNCRDGIYEDEKDITVEVKNGISRDYEKGCLCGGGCYLPKSVKNLVSIGVDFKEAVMAASVNPARWLGRKGVPQVGESVFLEGWNTDFEPEYVFLGKDQYSCKR